MGTSMFTINFLRFPLLIYILFFQIINQMDPVKNTSDSEKLLLMEKRSPASALQAGVMGGVIDGKIREIK